MNPVAILFLSVLLTCESVPVTKEVSEAEIEEKKVEQLADFVDDSRAAGIEIGGTHADWCDNKRWSYLMRCGYCCDECYYSLNDNSTAVKKSAEDFATEGPVEKAIETVMEETNSDREASKAPAVLTDDQSDEK
ncbi:unnamed protein product [Hymenolepis diminuta]|uniref:ShKT domain-containing protein n=1 Tax=Hymenolepis diminuta TaxID=6216 RepID=A0A0R3STZ2_HYMDI|nr:unnamed protein product [Hymenolepis diminuta]VUZ50642.1 unnamed protein product [Hymenolepis diminuta]